jgi:hypothetical protein
VAPGNAFSVLSRGLFLLSFDWSFPTVYYVQHSTLACDPRPLREKVARTKYLISATALSRLSVL